MRLKLLTPEYPRVCLSLPIITGQPVLHRTTEIPADGTIQQHNQDVMYPAVASRYLTVVICPVTYVANQLDLLYELTITPHSVTVIPAVAGRRAV